MTQPYILILYYSAGGCTMQLAKQIAAGADSIKGISSKLRTVPNITSKIDKTLPPIPSEGAIYCSKDDLANCCGLALGSPTRFGNIAAPLKYFLDQTADLWKQGCLVDKPACVFTSSNSLHGGQESTLLSMQIPLLHHGMLIMGIPFTLDALAKTSSGGSPYGATHVEGKDQKTSLSQEERQIAQALGKRLAEKALLLHEK